jgi:DNA-binding PadR family transcriptional regulator
MWVNGDTVNRLRTDDGVATYFGSPEIVSNDRLSLKQGSLYPALHRLEGRGWIEAEWGVRDAGGSAKFYRLTHTGREELEAEKEHWLSFASAVTSVLNME